ncbi:MAG: ABC transporter permease [Bryobacterales bacterium]|nr:ABC transporter permease [Bryobacterales bacterium]
MIGPVLKMALRALARNKVRSALTMLGIIIGVASVIAMVSLGQGAQKQVQQQINAMGTNLLIVMPGSQNMGGVRSGAGTGTTLTVDDVEALTQASTVAAVSPSVTAPVTVVTGNQNWSTRALGVSTSYPQIRNHDVASGEFFTNADVRSAARVALIGSTVANNLFPTSDPVGETIRLRNLPFRVIGVLQTKGQSQMGQDQDDIILIPYTTAMKKLLSTTQVSMAYVSAVSDQVTSETEQEITAILRERHSLRGNQENDFTVRNLSAVAETAQQTTRVLTILLGSIAGVSLLVGGIGIMNIMLVSVTERTREIGIRMAVGARSSHVRHQFLIESLVLGLSGGLVGILVGVGISVSMSSVFSWPTLISPVSIVVAAGFSMMIGAFFGYYPARKAANLDPIDALRFE